MTQDSYSFKWTGQKINRLLKLKAQGMTLTDIGKRFGITRNAVGGKLDRLKNPNRMKAYRSPRSNQRRPRVMARKTTPKPVGYRRPTQTNNKDIDKPFITPLKPPPASSQQAQFGSHKECRYPYGNIRENNLRFCLEPIQSGSSYCPEHHTLCHAPPRAFKPNYKINV